MKNRLPKIFFAVILGIMFTIGTTYALYTTSSSVNEKKSSIAKFGNVQVIESEAVRGSNGVYTLNKDKIVKSNEYIGVIPGVDIPKDPRVTISGVFEVNYIIYIIIDEKDLPSTVSYTVDNKLWKKNDSYSSESKYRYDYIGGLPVTENISILVDNTLFVSEKYVGNKNFKLTITAFVAQTH